MSDTPSKKPFSDFGFGEKSSTEGYRALNKDGTFNIVKTNIPFLERINIFQELITVSWTKFFGYVLVIYFVINLIFASAYWLIGMESLTVAKGLSPIEQFLEGFFFSAQTITTLGYGRVAPIGLLANIVAAFESLLGLLFFALATGLLYGRFSKPISKIKYSDKAIIAPYQDINGFMFRVVNTHKNQLLEVEATVSLSMKRDNSESRDFYALNLERKSVIFFPSIWTVVHPIDENSPLFNLKSKDYFDKDFEFITTIKAFYESSGQLVYSRTSFKPSDIEWGKKFIYPSKRKNGKIYIDVSLLNETNDVPLN